MNGGPAKANEWYSPRSPQTSAPDGSVARNTASSSRPRCSSLSRSRSTHTVTARKPRRTNSSYIAASVASPKWVAAFESGFGQEPVAKRPQVFQKNVAKDDHLDPRAFQPAECGEHGGSVHVIRRKGRARSACRQRARRVVVFGNHDELDREIDCVGLGRNQLSADAVHRYPVVGLADAGDELCNPDVGVALAGVMESKCAVLSAAPEESGPARCGHVRSPITGGNRSSSSSITFPCWSSFLPCGRTSDITPGWGNRTSKTTRRS
jgi:hypothetical protein